MLGRVNEAQGFCVKANSLGREDQKTWPLLSWMRLAMSLVMGLIRDLRVYLFGACGSTPVFEF
jgi:hypothetical protein